MNLSWSSSRRTTALVSLGAAAALALAGCGGSSGGSGGSGSGGDKPIVGLITKTDTNPYFVKMKEGAQQAADAAGVTLQSFAGKSDGDNEAQVQAIENLISAGAKGILITPSDSKAIVPEIDKAKQAGMLVVALDTPTDPADAVDDTFATDNFQAGVLVGQWAKAKLGAGAATAKIAMLDLSADQVSVDVKRDQGFMEGFGINVGDVNKIGDETDPRIVGHDVTQGAEDGGRTAMENLLQKDPSHRTWSTPSTSPRRRAPTRRIKAVRQARSRSSILVSIDGGCPGVENVQAGQSSVRPRMQFPLEDGVQQGVEAVMPTFIEGPARNRTVTLGPEVHQHRRHGTRHRLGPVPGRRRRWIRRKVSSQVLGVRPGRIVR